MQSDAKKRRKARQKRIRQRRLFIAFVLFLMIALITLGIMCFTLFFPIKRINVSGSKIYSKAEIVRASKLNTQDRLLAISESDIETTIRKKLPYVDSIDLKRKFPDAVIITVTDAKEQACYKVNENYRIISANGYVLKEQTELPPNVFEIVSSGIEGKTGGQIKYKNIAEQELVETLVTELENDKISINKVDVSNALEIVLRVEGRFTVILGTDEYLSEKISHLSSMIENIPDRSGKINLSMWTPQSREGTFIKDKE